MKKPNTLKIQSEQKQTELKWGNETEFLPDIRFAVVAAFTGFILYANTIGHSYVLDDAGVITENQFVQQGVKGIPEIFKSDLWHFANVNLGYYRPLSLVSFAVENEFFPNNPQVSHLTNVLLYALTGFFLCLFLMSLFNKFHPAFSLIVSFLLQRPIVLRV